MAKSKITISGVPVKEAKIKDKTVELVFKINMSEAVPKGLKPLGATNYLVQIGEKSWNKVKDKITENTMYRIEGEPKAALTIKQQPYVVIVAFNVEVFEPAPKQPKEIKGVKVEEPINNKVEVVEVKEVAQVNPVVQEEPKIEKPTKKEQKQVAPQKQFTRWFDLAEVQENAKIIDASKVLVKDAEHLKAYNINFSSSTDVKRYVVARPNGDDTYTLTIGFTNYACAKCYGLPLYVYVFDGSKEEFTTKFGINFVERIPERKKPQQNKRRGNTNHKKQYAKK